MITVSILIPTYNAENYLLDLINGLYSQVVGDEVNIEIIIIDSSSTDNTISIINDHFPAVKYKIINNKEFDHGGTRNLLASMATGEYLLFMTQDAIPYDPYLIQNLLEPMENSDIIVSFARQIPKKDAHSIEVFMRGFNYPYQSQIKDRNDIEQIGIKTFFNSNVCSLYERKSFEKLGKFPEEIILNEDMIFASKAILNGFKVSYTADAKVFHSHNYTIVQQFKRYFDIGMAFEQTKFLLEHASNEKEGFRLVLNLWKYLVRNNKANLIPYSIIETAAKYVGYLFGKKHFLFSYNLKRKFSAYMK
jgi:rhamnosyltransferase